MHVLILPSLFPTELLPKAGIFVLEQAKLLAAKHPEHHFSIFSWCPEQYQMDIRRPSTFLRGLSLADDKTTQLSDNLTLYEVPTVVWNRKLGGHRFVVNNCIEFIKQQKLNGSPVDLIHAHFGYPAGHVAKLIKDETGLPYVVTEHMGPFPFEHLQQGPHLVSELKNAYANAAKIFSVSNFQKNQMDFFHIENVEVIPNFIDENLFNMTSNEKNDPFRFLYVGNLISTKGIFDLLEATKILKEKNLKFVVDVVGFGLEAIAVRDYVNKYDLNDYINLLGDQGRAEILKFFQTCDAFVLPSHIESFGIVYLEAMACGKPVIATSHGGPNDYVTPQVGFLIEPKDIHALCDAMIALISNEKFKPSEIRDYILNNYSSKNVTEQLVRKYNEVVAQK